MNYIKKLEAQKNAFEAEVKSLGQSLIDLEVYLLSPKFHQDTTVQVQDILNRIGEMKANAFSAYLDNNKPNEVQLKEK